MRGLVHLGMNIAIGNRLRYTGERSNDGLAVAARLYTHTTAVVQNSAILHSIDSGNQGVDDGDSRDSDVSGSGAAEKGGSGQNDR